MVQGGLLADVHDAEGVDLIVVRAPFVPLTAQELSKPGQHLLLDIFRWVDDVPARGRHGIRRPLVTKPISYHTP